MCYLLSCEKRHALEQQRHWTAGCSCSAQTGSAQYRRRGRCAQSPLLISMEHENVPPCPKQSVVFGEAISPFVPLLPAPTLLQVSYSHTLAHTHPNPQCIAHAHHTHTHTSSRERKETNGGLSPARLEPMQCRVTRRFALMGRQRGTIPEQRRHCVVPRRRSFPLSPQAPSRHPGQGKWSRCPMVPPCPSGGGLDLRHPTTQLQLCIDGMSPRFLLFDRWNLHRFNPSFVSPAMRIRQWPCQAGRECCWFCSRSLLSSGWRHSHF